MLRAVGSRTSSDGPRAINVTPALPYPKSGPRVVASFRAYRASLKSPRCYRVPRRACS